MSARPPPRPTGSEPRTSRRRALLASATGVLSLATCGLEAQSLRGGFDHWRAPDPSPTAADRYRAARARLDAGAHAATGAVVHVGHSTHLLALGGARMLTDPWFFDPAFGALHHERGPAVAPEHIGPLDAVLLSHDHPDHADPRALDRLDKRAQVFTATEALAARVRRLGFSQVHTMRPWQTATVGSSRARLTAVPALHDVEEIGFVIEHDAGAPVYFAGDTALNPAMPAIGERFRPALAILPVDGTRITGAPRLCMDPGEAARAAVLLGARAAMPSHADSVIADPLARHLLASTVPYAREAFRDALRARTRGAVACVMPESGELVAVPG